MLKVLIVDDEEIIRKSLNAMIPWSELGCTVVAISRNGVEAYQQVSDYYPDIVITDMMMPVMDGLELIEKVRLLDSDAEFIVLSGYGEFELAQKAMRFGVKHYLLKPTKKADLVAILKSVVNEIHEKEIRRKEEYLKLVREFGFYFQKGILLELLNNPASSQPVLDRNMNILGLQGVENACLLGLGTDASRYRSTVIEMYNYCKVRKTELLMAPVLGNDVIYCILHIENISMADTFRQHAASEDYSVSVFLLDSIATIFSELMRCIGGCKEIQIFDVTGRSEYLFNDNGFVRNIQSLGTDIARSAKDGRDVQLLLDELGRALSACSVNEAKSVMLSLATTLHGDDEEVLGDHLLVLMREANSIEEILKYVKQLVRHQLATNVESGSYPVRTIKKYIEQNLSSESISLKWIAENLLCMNVGYLSKLFLKEVGVKFSDYINRLRISSAKRLMTVYHESMIQEIAQEVGFGNNPRYFSQVFRKYEGVTPTEYMHAIKTQKMGGVG